MTTYPGSAVPITEGQHTISYWSVDTAGNTGRPSPSHGEGRHDNPVDLTIDAFVDDGSTAGTRRRRRSPCPTGATSGSGIAATSYTVDSGAAQTIAGSAVSIPRRPAHDHFLRTTSPATRSTTRPVTVKVDTGNPVTALATTPGTRTAATTGSSGRASLHADRDRPGRAHQRLRDDIIHPRRRCRADLYRHGYDEQPGRPYHHLLPTDNAANVETRTRPISSSTTSTQPRRSPSYPASPNGTNVWYKTSAPATSRSSTVSDTTSGVATTFYVDAATTQT